MQAFVTVGGGFLGGAIVRLLRRHNWSVRSYSRSAHPWLDALGVEQVQGDLATGPPRAELLRDCDVVFHVAAKAGVWGPRKEYVRTNVEGTRNVLDACRTAGVRKFVFTSSPSVTFAGCDQDGVDERVPYPTRWLAPYPQTKARAEQLVLEANGDQLASVSLRPHLIWGPGDPHLVPRILERGRAGKLRIVGDRSKKVDSVYIDNAASAHLLAAKRLAPGAPPAGRAYFITNGEPMPLVTLIDGILKAGGQPPVSKTISAGLAYAAGTALEGLYRLAGTRKEPPLTRFVALQLSTAHWFDISAARRDLGYEPKVSIQQGLLRLQAHLDSEC